jgi:hypothetical protein
VVKCCCYGREGVEYSLLHSPFPERFSRQSVHSMGYRTLTRSVARDPRRRRSWPLRHPSRLNAALKGFSSSHRRSSIAELNISIERLALLLNVLQFRSRERLCRLQACRVSAATASCVAVASFHICYSLRVLSFDTMSTELLLLNLSQMCSRD